MRWLCLQFVCLGMLTILLGCRTTPPTVKPPKEPESFTLPPNNDPRFHQPIQYPKDALNRDPSESRRTFPGQPGPNGNRPTRMQGV